MAAEVFAILQEYKLKKCLLAVTTDNCSNNEFMQRALSELLERRDII